MKSIIKKGDKFGRLTAVRFSHCNKSSYWLFKCSCGNEKVIRLANVKNGSTKSCGCLCKETMSKLGKASVVHNMSGTRTYGSWRSMKRRCLNKNTPKYKYWGGRGITICKEWLEFENFYRDMGERPENKSLDRIDNNKGYYKENCRWANIEQQANNRRNNRFITYKENTLTIRQWEKKLGINRGTLHYRIDRGWSTERALTYNIKI